MRIITYTSLILLVACNRLHVDPLCLREQHVEEDSCVYEHHVLVWPEESVTLDEAIQVALANNLDLRVRAEEACIQQEMATRELTTMLPKYQWSIDNNSRHPFLGSSSQSLLPGVPPAPPSVATENHSFRTDIQLSWNIVDFALAFIGTRKATNTVWLRRLEYIRAEQRLAFDVTQKYWDVLVLREAAHMTTDFIERADSFVDAMDALISEGIISPVQGGRLQSQVVDDEIRLKHYKKLYIQAQAELKEMMGLPPDYPLVLAALPADPPQAPQCTPDFLFDIAVHQRPELFFHDVEEVIHQDDVRRALVQLLPDMDISGGIFYDANTFLLHHLWHQVAVRAAIKLFEMPVHVQGSRVAKARLEQVRMKRRVMAAAVMSQVYLSYSQYHASLENYNIATKVFDVKRKLWAAYAAEATEGVQSQASVLEAEGHYINAHIEALRSKAEMGSSVAQLHMAIGIPLLNISPNVTPHKEDKCSAI